MPPRRRPPPRGAPFDESSEEDEAGISSTRSRREIVVAPRRSSRQAGQSSGPKRAEHFGDGLDALPVRKMRRGLLDTRRQPSRPETHRYEDADVLNEGTPDDDEVAPQNPAFFARINEVTRPKITAGNETLGATPTRDSSSHVNATKEKHVAAEAIYEVPESEPEVEAEDQEGEQQPDLQPQHASSQQLPDLRGEPSLFVPESSDPGVRRKSRNKPKTPYGSVGYLRTRAGSEELGSEAVVPATSQRDPVLAKQPQGPVVSLQSENVRNVSLDGADGDHDEGEEEVGDVTQMSQPGHAERTLAQAASQEHPTEGNPDQSLAVGEDSLLFEAPRESAALVKVTLSSDNLREMLSRLASTAWTGDGIEWQENFLAIDEGDSRPRPRWLRRHTIGLKAPRCQKLLQYLHYLWDACHQMPKAPNFEGQEAYMRGHEEQLRKLIRIIHASIERVSNRQTHPTEKSQDASDRPDWVPETVKWLRRKLIPMLVLLLKEVFMIGGQGLVGDQPAPLDKGEFTQTALELLLRITGWTLRLNEVLKLYLEAYPPQPVTDAAAEKRKLKIEARDRNAFSKELAFFKNSLGTAMDDLDEVTNGPQRRLEAMEHDRQARIERERKETERLMAENRQMQLFVASTQKMSTSTAGSQTSQDQYYEKHGFFYWEDEQLLKLIREVPNPDYRVLEATFVNRNYRELKHRAKELKASARRKYEAANLVPPLWCYSSRGAYD